MGEITPDERVYWTWQFVRINATIVYTWATMAFLVLGSWLITRKLSTGPELSRWQNFLEVIVDYTRKQIQEISQQKPDRYLAFIGTLFVFIAVSNALAIVPGYVPPTASLSTTAALAICVLVAVPVFGITRVGLGAYLRNYIRPNPVMLPFNIVGELSRTLALAVRLFGNVMSGVFVVGIVLSLAGLLVPIPLMALDLLTGAVQAYIFTVLAMVFIGATLADASPQSPNQQQGTS